mmetsp:Transcript_37957/g.79997  ORF Transcript_37957/g.79997 Transcript_37957/m.79997 type:complete len:164 (-) Transcript_37957:222-713(-)
MSTNNIVKTNADQQPMEPFLCPLCCEHDLSPTASSGVTLSSCGHRSCKTCLIKWIEKEETSGQLTPPTCPFCRSPISESDASKVMGRTLQPRNAIAAQKNGEENIDDLTLQWLNEQTVLCPGCSSRVQKDGGCNHVTCLCGYNFCYSCRGSGSSFEGRCGCNI